MTTQKPATSKAVPPRQRLIGLLLIGAIVVAVTVALLLLRQPPARTATPPPQASSSPSPTPSASATIPDEARTTVWRSDTPATGQYTASTTEIAPKLKATSTRSYVVVVETSVKLDPNATAAQIQSVLDDPRGWAGYGKTNFRLIKDPKQASLTIYVASPATTDTLCAPTKTGGLWSCRKGATIVINSDRWQYMVPTYNNLDEYRAWVINHQIGRLLGQGTAFCPAKGKKAPVMSLQERDLAGCLPNAWPRLAD